MGLQLGFPFRLLRRTNLNYSQHCPQITPDSHIQLTTLDLSVNSLLQVLMLQTPRLFFFSQSGVATSRPASYLLPGVCFSQVIFFIPPPSFYLLPKSSLASLCWGEKKQQSFNCNFRAGSPVKEWCSFSCAVAVRHICHWQDYLRKNICQTHTRAAAENADSAVSVDVALGSVSWDSDG